MAEPGRFLAAPSLTSISSVVGKAVWIGKTWYYLDDGVYGTYSGEINDQTLYPITVPYVKGEHKISALSGPTCDCFDMVRDEISLPELNIGDLVIGKMIGAYTWAAAATFNSIPKTRVVVVDSNIKELTDQELEETYY